MDDLISRSALLAEYDKVHVGIPGKARKLIEDAPSAQRKGKWIHKPGIYGAVYCSECDFELRINDTPYCPNCGAEMVKGESDG